MLMVEWAKNLSKEASAIVGFVNRGENGEDDHAKKSKEEYPSCDIRSVEELV